MPAATAQPIQFKKGKLGSETLLKLYRRLLKPRMIEEKMLILLRQGTNLQMVQRHRARGHRREGATSVLLPDELVFTLHRNLGVFTVREVPLATLFSQWQGKKSGFSKGRERSFHLAPWTTASWA